jgi:hypothetical protein
VAQPEPEIDVDALARQGRGIIGFGWFANAIFAATAIPVAAGVEE